MVVANSAAQVSTRLNTGRRSKPTHNRRASVGSGCSEAASAAVIGDSHTTCAGDVLMTEADADEPDLAALALDVGDIAFCDALQIGVDLASAVLGQEPRKRLADPFGREQAVECRLMFCSGGKRGCGSRDVTLHLMSAPDPVVHPGE